MFGKIGKERGELNDVDDLHNGGEVDPVAARKNLPFFGVQNANDGATGLLARGGGGNQRKRRMPYEKQQQQQR